MDKVKEANHVVDCILPGQTNKIRLSIIMKKKPISKQKKSLFSVQIEKDKKTEKEKSQGLFAALLKVTTQLEEDDKKKD